MNVQVGRPLEFDPDVALEAAMGVFWRKGFDATSMQDLLAAMDISKSSLYQAFGGKQPLFRRCMTRYTDNMAGYMRERLESAPSGWSFIEGFLYSVLNDIQDEAARRGCLVMNTASEFAQRDVEIAHDVTHSIGRFQAVLLAAVERAQREGDIPLARNPKVLADFLVSSMSGLKTQAKAGADTSMLRGIIVTILAALG